MSRKWGAVQFTIPYLALTLYSRPYFGMHYPSDVLGGSLSGILLGLVISWFQRRVYGVIAGRRPPNPEAKARG